MHCDRAAELIGAYVDQELDADTRREVAAHLGGCTACSAAAEDIRRTSGALAAIGREPAPESLVADVQMLLAGTELEATPPSQLAILESLRRPDWLRQAAALLLACALSSAATALLMSHWTAVALLEREIVAAHVRSLLQDSPTQITSSDAHAIKPWFAGRLDFAASVKDLTAEGFPLAGARLDYIGERRVAALVYRRRLHVINVFLWPSADGMDSAPRELVYRGYNIVMWSKGGITRWAISDLGMAELRKLQSYL